MNAKCDRQLHFSFRNDRQICLDFQGGQITSDTGLSSLREFDHRIGFSRSIAQRFTDRRHPSYIRHSLTELLIPRLYGIIAGYEDQNDPQRLRHDELFQLIAGKPELGQELAGNARAVLTQAATAAGCMTWRRRRSGGRPGRGRALLSASGRRREGKLLFVCLGPI